jgi:AbrB family looped-hinge helix DNA binding protein
MFDISRVTANGQVTIPLAMRRQLGIKEGDKVVFYNEGNHIVIANAAMEAFTELQKAFEGEADRLGLKNEDDVTDMVKKIRRERWGERYGDNA